MDKQDFKVREARHTLLSLPVWNHIWVSGCVSEEGLPGLVPGLFCICVVTASPGTVTSPQVVSWAMPGASLCPERECGDCAGGTNGDSRLGGTNSLLNTQPMQQGAALVELRGQWDWEAGAKRRLRRRRSTGTRVFCSLELISDPEHSLSLLASLQCQIIQRLYIDIYLYTYLFINAHSYVYISVYKHIFVYITMYINIYIYVYKYTHIFIYTHMEMCALILISVLIFNLKMS